MKLTKERNAIKAHTALHFIALLHVATYQDRLQGDTESTCCCQALLCMVRGLIVKFVL
jgi:hypothetical protein